MNGSDSWKTRHRLLIVALVPSLSIAVLLGLSFSINHALDLQQLMKDRGKACALQLATVARFAIEHGNRAELDRLSAASLEENGVRAVTIYDNNRTPIAHAGPKMRPASDSNDAPWSDGLVIRNSEDTYRFQYPIHASHLTSDLDSTLHPQSSAGTQRLGWIEVEYDVNRLTLRKYKTFLVSSLLLLIALLVSAMVSLRISHRVMNVVGRLHLGMDRIKSGDYGSQITVDDGSDVAGLVAHVNEMSSGIQRRFQEMRQNVEQTTSDLRETLETLEIQNIELDLARKEALEASRIKSEFLANTSHEIRTPLNGIIGFTNLLTKTSLLPRQREYLDTIRQSSENLLTIINDILDFSRIEAGKLVLDNTLVDIREIVDDTLTMLAPAAHEKGLDLIPMVYPDLPTHLMGDPLRIKQVVTNLVSNAIKFTNKGYVLVKVRVEQQQGQQVQLMLSVSDTGVGLSQEQQRDIFKAFTQISNTVTRVHGGTGLGLAISRHLVEQMGGEIGLESEIGKGSTFWFSLKTKLADLETSHQNFTALNGKHIAIYDPNPTTLLGLRMLLESFDVTIETLEALPGQDDALQFASLDAAIIGFDSENMEGLTDTRIRRLHRKLGCPLLLLAPTTDSQHFDIEEGPSLAFLHKPAAQRKLFTSIDKLINPVLPATTGTPGSISAERRGPHILAVDDNPTNLELLTELLLDLGCQVTRARSGEEAINFCKQRVFDLIFMDIQMPGIDGVTAAKHIRAMAHHNASVPILALTAHALAEERRKLLAAGFNEHLSKPIDERTLGKALSTWLPSYEGIHPPLGALEAPLPSNRPVDVGMCLTLANNKSKLARDMLRGLLERLPATEQAIAHAYSQMDYAGLLDHVHKLHGAACYTGVPLLRAAAHQLETCLKRHDNEHTDSAYETLKLEMDRLLQWHDEHEIDILFDAKQDADF